MELLESCGEFNPIGLESTPPQFSAESPPGADPHGSYVWVLVSLFLQFRASRGKTLVCINYHDWTVRVAEHNKRWIRDYCEEKKDGRLMNGDTMAT